MADAKMADPNTFLIQLKPDADIDAFEEHVKTNLGGKVTHKSKLVPGQVHVEIPKDVVHTFDSHESVESAELDKTASIQ